MTTATDVPCTTSPELFFSDNRRHRARAKEMCSSCPVQRQCFELAVAGSEGYGVWAGLTAQERADLGLIGVAS